MHPRTVVCPFIDVIDCNNFEYRPQDQGMRGSFAWNFDYKRLPLRKGDQADPATPFASPVMAGGYFAISAKWFWELGGYDEGLDIWGGEQYELSFKVCRLLYVIHVQPCSLPCQCFALCIIGLAMPRSDAGRALLPCGSHLQV